jgi:hypothetical protein
MTLLGFEREALSDDHADPFRRHLPLVLIAMAVGEEIRGLLHG